MLKMVAVFPHPPVIIPVIGGREAEPVRQTTLAVRDLAGRIAAMNPQLLVIITPHGTLHRQGPTILTGGRLTGDFGAFGFPGTAVSMTTDPKLAACLEAEARAAGEGLVSCDALESSMSLDHGAMVPLYFLQEAGLEVRGLHLTTGPGDYREAHRFGPLLRKALDRRGLPAVILISADFSHRLKPGAPGGYSPRGAEFDSLVLDLLKKGDVSSLVHIDTHLAGEAGECGLRPLVMGLGALKGGAYDPEILSYEGPFGVGYLVAALYPPGGQAEFPPSGEKSHG